MASALIPGAPVLFRQHNFQWNWNPIANNNDQHQKYSDVENEIIEDAYNKKQIEVEIDGNYVVDLQRLVQYKKDEAHKQFTVKRIQLDTNCSNAHLQTDRFALPVTLVLSSSPSTSLKSEKMKDGMLAYALMKIGDFPRAYFCKAITRTGKTIADVVKAAAEEILKEGVQRGLKLQAESLYQQLLTVEHFGANIIPDIDTILPIEIGQTLVNMYTRETFWYKLINRLMRDQTEITDEQMQSIGPFCYLLQRYLNQIQFQPRSNLVLYRGLQIEDDGIQEFMEKDKFVRCLSFTSTSKNREVAELFGNTLLIIEFHVDEGGVSEGIYCSSRISDVSAIQVEEEFLIRPPAGFRLIKYEYDTAKQKHIIHLRT